MRKPGKGIQKITFGSSCGIGVAVGLLSTVLFVAIGVLCINNEYVTMENMGVIAALIQLFSVMLASITAGEITADKQIICSAATSGISFLTYIGVAILFFDGISGALLSGTVTTVIGLVVSFFVVKRRENRSVRRKNKMRSR